MFPNEIHCSSIGCVNVPIKNSPAQPKKMFSKNFENLTFLTVFSASIMKNSPAQAKNLGTPFFAGQRAQKIFWALLRFCPRFGDNVSSNAYKISLKNSQINCVK